MLQSLIKHSIRSPSISISPAPFQSSLDVRVPYKISGKTLREGKFALFSSHIDIVAVPGPDIPLTVEEEEHIRQLYN
jgi:hypothetical protein